MHHELPPEKNRPFPPALVALAKEKIDACCPCCRQPVDAPTLHMVVEMCELSEAQEIVLSTAWRGAGHPVATRTFLDAIFRDDPDGGPEDNKRYASFKETLHRTRRKLAGSGVGIVNCSYAGGYRLVISHGDLTDRRGVAVFQTDVSETLHRFASYKGLPAVVRDKLVDAMLELAAVAENLGRGHRSVTPSVTPKAKRSSATRPEPQLSH
ncbi:MAG: hypothetical protein F2813_00360 [Actinobacteria bacterium]|uniref:Unannotated protein n=1 Tax=freshwater metagenome TaxID=449393 RepID=A0A6J5YVJ9_9ZZZZ|nr:hypothetical protein [Actinomycetota bacterium]